MVITTKEEWHEIKTKVDEMKKLSTYNQMPSQVKDDGKEVPWYHKESIVTLSKGGCTPEGKLIKTIGMSRKDLPKQIH